MKILYLSAHSIHEYDDYRLFLELGHEVFSVNAAYTNPRNPADPTARPTIPEGKFYTDLFRYQLNTYKNDLSDKLIEWCDVVYVQHKPMEWILPVNWEKVKKLGKLMIWRGTGQSVQKLEEEMAPLREEGLLAVRYSPRERMIPSYCGEDAMIRFYKDPDEWKDWNGKKKRVVTVTQSIKKRRVACNWDAFNEATKGLPRKVYGRGNEDLGELWAGEVSYEELLNVYRDNRVYFYTSTQPTSYCLNFIEALMTGAPVVSVGPELGNSLHNQDTFEIHDIIENGVNGFWSDDPVELRNYVKILLKDKRLAKQIGDAGRKKALGLFRKEKIKREWKEFFDSL